MNPKRRKRFAIVLMILTGTGLAVGLVVYALEQNINLFYTTTQIAQGEAPASTRIRVGGMVVDGSVQRSTRDLQVSFMLTDYANQVKVVYTGILPDLFREGQGIIAQGKLDSSGIFQANEVLAKHDENYMPPEVAESLKHSEKMGGVQ